jgi:hypothetical protein
MTLPATTSQLLALPEQVFLTMMLPATSTSMPRSAPMQLLPSMRLSDAQGVDASAVARAISVEAAGIVEDQARAEDVDAVAHIAADGASANGASRAGRDAVTAVGVRGAFRDDGPGSASDP